MNEMIAMGKLNAQTNEHDRVLPETNIDDLVDAIDIGESK